MTELMRNIELLRKELTILKEKLKDIDPIRMVHINKCLTKLDIIQDQISVIWLVYESFYGSHGCREAHDNCKIIGVFTDENEAKKCKKGTIFDNFIVKLEVNKIINKDLL